MNRSVGRPKALLQQPSLAPGIPLVLGAQRIRLLRRCSSGVSLECKRVDAMLSAARERRSSALVVRGEAGIGKSAYSSTRSSEPRGFASCVRSEWGRGRARVGRRPATRPSAAEQAGRRRPPLQARTLRTAFAIEGGPVPDRFAVSVATLSLLAGAAVEEPLLCVVDDAQWLDQASAEALTFAARRLHADAV